MSNTLAPAPADSAAAPAPDTATPPITDEPAAPVAPEAAPPSADGAPGAADADEGKTVPLSRFKEVVAERNATRDYAEYFRQQALSKVQAPAPAAAAPTAKPAPTLADFKDEATGQYDALKWSSAYAKWSEDQIAVRAEAIVDQRLTAREQRAQQEQTTTSWQSKCAEFRSKHPDFDVVTANPTLPIPKSVADVIVTLDNGPAVFHHLGTNPAEAARIARLPPAQQAVALGKLDAKVVAPAAPVQRQHSKAPPPPSAIRPGTGTEINMETCSLDDFLAHRMPAKKR